MPCPCVAPGIVAVVPVNVPMYAIVRLLLYEHVWIFRFAPSNQPISVVVALAAVSIAQGKTQFGGLLNARPPTASCLTVMVYVAPLLAPVNVDDATAVAPNWTLIAEQFAATNGATP